MKGQHMRCPYYSSVIRMDGCIAVNKMIVFVVNSGYTLVKMHMTSLYPYAGACYYGVIVDMLAVLRRIAGYEMHMAFKIRILGGSTRELVHMSEYLCCFALVAVCMQLVIHVTHPLLTAYA